MVVRARARLVKYVAALVLVVPVGLSLLPNSNEPSCVRINAWINSHRNSLPTQFTELRRYPSAYRRPILGAVTPEVKATIVRQAVTDTLGSGALTDEQKRLVQRVLAQVQPSLYAHRLSEDERAQLDALEHEVISSFPNERLAAYRSLGGSDVSLSASHISPAVLWLSEATRRYFVVRAGAFANCNCYCNIDSGWDNYNCYVSTGGYAGCNGTMLECKTPPDQNNNCGFWMGSPCDGACGGSCEI